ncbi:MAG: calcium-binding protein [Phormidium sp.]
MKLHKRHHKVASCDRTLGEILMQLFPFTTSISSQVKERQMLELTNNSNFPETIDEVFAEKSHLENTELEAEKPTITSSNSSGDKSLESQKGNSVEILSNSLLSENNSFKPGNKPDFVTDFPGQNLSELVLPIQAQADFAVTSVTTTSYTGGNIGDVINGVDGLFDTLQNAVNQRIFGNALPIVGNQLQNSNQSEVNFIKDFEDDVLGKLREKLDGIGNKTPELVREALAEALGNNGLKLLQDANNDGQVNSQDIGLIQTADDVKFDLKLKQSVKSFNTSLASNIGIPGLGLTTNGNAQVGIGFDFNLKFGVHKTNGFYFDTSATDELKIGVNASTPNLDATGKLGFLQLNVKDKGSQFNSTFSVDLRDADNQLRFSELPSVNLANLVSAKLTGGADVKLGLATTFNGSTIWPSVSSDFNLNWTFNNALADPSQNQTFGNRPTVAFDNVKLNMGSFFSNFARPVLENVQKITQPLQPVIEALTTPIDMGVNKFTLLDVAQQMGKIDQNDRNFIESISQVVRVVNSIPTSSDLSIDLGKFNLGTTDIRANNFNLSTVNPTITLPTIPTLSQMPTGSAEANFVSSFKSIPGAGLQFPILEDPKQAFNLFLGKDADLFKYDLPRFEFNFDYSQIFPILGPLSAEIKGQVSAAADVDFGYDTAGLRQFGQSGNVADIANGFYVNDPTTPELMLNARLEAFAAINAVLGSAGVGGGIYGNINFDLKDPNNDQKVRFNELVELLQNPLTMFDTSGELSAGLTAYARFGVDPFMHSFQYDSPRLTLLSFGNNTGSGSGQPQPTSATILSGGVLRLNMGPNAIDRTNGNTTDGSEVFRIARVSGTAGNETLSVTAFNVTREYSGISKIVADGGENDDLIELHSAVLTAAELAGGKGQDQLIGGSGNDSLNGGDGWDKLVGGNGSDSLLGGTGDDLLVGGAGVDLLNGGDGFDIASYETATAGVLVNLGTNTGTGDAAGDIFQSIERVDGSNFDDTLIGDSGDNQLRGGAGNDLILGGAGNDLLVGGAGADTLDGESGMDAVSYIGSAAGVSINLATGTATGGDAQGDVLRSIERVEGSEKADILIGDSSNNILSGLAGNDSLNGDAGNDLLNGDAGADTIDGSAGDDTVSYATSNPGTSNAGVTVNLATGAVSGGHAAGDVLVSVENIIGSNFNDNLTGNAGNNIINPGLGVNYAYGGDGDDLLIMDFSVNETGKGVSSSSGWISRQNSNGIGNADAVYQAQFERFHITGTSSNDQWTGAVGNDTMIGGLGDDTISSSSGNDSILGGAGNDSLNGETGNDWIFGGDGDDFIRVTDNDPNKNDTLDGGAGIDTLVADFSNQTQAMVFDSTNPTAAQYTFADGTTVRNFEVFQTLRTGSGNDQIVQLGRVSNTFSGGAGNDTINAGLGINDMVSGDAGDDLLILDYSVGDTGKAVIFGTNGWISRQNSNGIGNADALFHNGFERFYTIGTDYNDQLLGVAGNDTLIGGLGNDTISSGTGNDSIVGGAGNDSLDAATGSDRIFAGDGDDWVRVINDVTSQNDTLDGGAGIDTLAAADFSNQTQGMVFDSSNPIPEQIFADGTTIRDFEVFVNLTTGAGSDRITQLGRLNNDFRAGAGNDTINPGLGANDYLLGDAGDDLLILDYSVGDTGKGVISSNGVWISRQNSSGTGNADHLYYNGFERLHITGTDYNDQLLGATGSDTLSTGAGDDTLTGNGGADILRAGVGNDVYSVNTASGGTQIQDAGGTDSLILSGITLSLNRPNTTSHGIQRNGTTLAIDLNRDGVINAAQDLTILDFFAGTSGNQAGVGFIETVGNLAGNNILNSGI